MSVNQRLNEFAPSSLLLLLLPLPVASRVWEACGIYSPVIFTSRGDTPLLSHLFLQREARDYGEEREVGGCPGREVVAKSPLTSDCVTGRARVTLTIIIVKQDAHRRRLLVHVRDNMTAIFLLVWRGERVVH